MDDGHEDENPRNALSSSTFIHSWNFSSTITWMAYLLLSLTIFSIRSAEKKSWKTSNGDGEMRQIGDVNGLREYDHEVQLLVLVSVWVLWWVVIGWDIEHGLEVIGKEVSHAHPLLLPCHWTCHHYDRLTGSFNSSNSSGHCSWSSDISSELPISKSFCLLSYYSTSHLKLPVACRSTLFLLLHCSAYSYDCCICSMANCWE